MTAGMGVTDPGGSPACARPNAVCTPPFFALFLLSSRRYDPTECRRRIEAQLDTLVERGIRHAVLSGAARKSSQSTPQGAWPLV